MRALRWPPSLLPLCLRVCEVADSEQSQLKSRHPLSVAPSRVWAFVNALHQFKCLSVTPPKASCFGALKSNVVVYVVIAFFEISSEKGCV